jgi:glycosyltransferase involved in cell wall biosynthesis
VAERLLGRLTDQYYAVCCGQVPYLTDYLRLPRSKIKVVHNGVDPSAYDLNAAGRMRTETRRALGLPDAAPVAGIVATLREEKDHATFLRAFAMVKRELPDARALVAGDGPCRGALEDLARDLDLGASVRFLGTRTDVPNILAASDVIALSSYTVECFPYAILEAMAMARPSVVTAIAGLPELVVDGETGWLVPTRSPDMLADRLVLLLRDPERRRAMGLAARARLEAHFTLNHSVGRAVDEITTALGDELGRSPRANPLQAEHGVEVR